MILVILAGGKGLRLKELTKNNPKPMVKINKRPFLEKLILNYSKYNLEKIFILTGYKYKKIHSYFNKKFINGVEIKCINENKIMGTGGALYRLKNIIKKNFFLVNGDTYLDVNLNHLNAKVDKKKLVNIFLTKKNQNSNDTLKLDKNSNIVYDQKSKYISSGLYYFNYKFLNTIKNRPCSLERDVLPDLIKRKIVSGDFIKGFFVDIGTLPDLKKFIKINSKPKKVIFLDRDGVINHDEGYTFKINDFKFKSKIIKYLNKFKKNHIFFIVTNQSGIGRGYYSLKDFYSFHQYLKLKLSEKNIFISDLEFCPHYKKSRNKKYKINCNCRKPKNLMFKNLIKRWNININKSFMIGDSKKDYLFSKKSKLRFKYYSNL